MAPPSICLHFNASQTQLPVPAPAWPGTGKTHHDVGRPLLGCKLRGKSQRELRHLGLIVDNPAPGTGS